MTIRDLGYRPYDGPRLPPSNNTWVMLRQGMRRAWASWLVKLAVFLSFGPPLIGIALVIAGRMLLQQGDPEADPIQASAAMRNLFSVQTWLFVSMITVGAGAPAIAEDLTFRGFQFYFAKPVTPAQYLAGRVLAVAICVFLVTFVPAFFLDLALVGTAPRALIAEQAGLLLPAFFYSLVLATVMGTTSVAVSSLSKSRALTMSAWIVAFIVPHVLASVVNEISVATGNEEGWPWLFLGSFTGLLGNVADALFKVERDAALEWYYAAPILVALTVGSTWLAMYRLQRAEVIT
ncbi:MAG: ABC transporter permease [Myxococcota bacterium]|nr:ABC transporter permease [Myxococcota bacterium]